MSSSSHNTRPVRSSGGSGGHGGFGRSSLLWTLYVPSFLLQVGVGMLIPVLPSFIEEMGVGVGLIGLGVSGVLIGTMIFDVPSGLLVGRFGHKQTMLWGTISLGVLALVTAFTTSFPAFMVLRLLAGTSMALWSISRMAYVSDTVPSASRGKTLATFGGVQRIGAFAGPVIGGVIGAQISLEAVFIAQALMSAATVLMLIGFTEEIGGDRADQIRRQGRSPVLRTIADNGAGLARGGTAMVSLQFVRRGRELVLPLWGTHLGLEVDQIGYVIGAAAAVDMAMFAPVGYVMDRYGRKWMSVPSFLVLGMGMALLPLTGNIWTFSAIAVLTGFGNGLSSGAMMTLGADLAPRQRASEFIGVWRLIGDIGGASGPILVGQMANVVTLGWSSVFIAAFGFLGASGVYFIVPETLGRDEGVETAEPHGSTNASTSSEASDPGN
ncbi:MAG: MFS transporter [Dehalococcoidia bacterium]|nr:MFS transporter [Dehalococcoidia bacterium]